VSRRPQAFVSEWTQAFRDSEIPADTARLVGYALATFASADGRDVRPGTSRLVVAANLSRSSVLLGLKHLRESGWIEEVPPTPGGPARKAKEYRLTLPPDVDQWVKRGQAKVAEARAEKARRDAQWGDARRDRRRGARP
jgi:hypothetical protein